MQALEERLSLEELENVDRLCDEFESQLHAGQLPRVDSFTEGVTGWQRLLLLRELMAVELEYRRSVASDRGDARPVSRFSRETTIPSSVLCCLQECTAP